jgi:acyl-homoserine-lactone acylase
MSSKFSRSWSTLLAASVLATAVGCSDSNNNNGNQQPPEVIPPPEPELTYEAEIVWTEYGIPHVTAADWGSLGYGYAYAYSQQNYCIVMKEIVKSNGNSALYLGDDAACNTA